MCDEITFDNQMIGGDATIVSGMADVLQDIMTPGEAKELSHLLERVGGLPNQSVAFVRGQDTEDNFIEYRIVIGKLMGDLFLNAMTPLYKRFPDLPPDYLGGPCKIGFGGWRQTQTRIGWALLIAGAKPRR